jgi:hypothetical protein
MSSANLPNRTQPCSLACSGLPSGEGIRARVWQLLLGYLPPARAAWAPTQQRRRQEYKSFCADFRLKPQNDVRPHVLRAALCMQVQLQSCQMYPARCSQTRGQICGWSTSLCRHVHARGVAFFVPVQSGSAAEDPLATSPKGGAWSQFFADREAAEQIARDVERTHTGVPFFGADADASRTHCEARVLNPCQFVPLRRVPVQGGSSVTSCMRVACLQTL